MTKEELKKHLSDNKKFYIGLSAGAGIAGITYLIMRNNSTQPISRGIAVTASRGIAVTGKKVVMENVSYISSNRSGPPSWVVRCVQTGQIYTSQTSAANEMGLKASEISRHLNGLRDTVRGYTFERICLSA